MTKLHIFDMDGTLLHGSACLHISEYAGKLAEVNVIEEGWSRGEVGHVEFFQLCLPLWGELSEADIDEIFARTPWKQNVPQVFEDITRRGEYSAVVTLSPLFFVTRLLHWGAMTAHGAEVFGGRAPDPELVLTPHSKVGIAASLMERYRIGPEDCIAYGDSSSDIPLFRTLPNTVAVNGSAALREIAAATYDGDDIWEAYAVGRKLVGI
ncbi:MAG TPA: haloacid dehalogenase-like hydrolase [Stellaceae bacterium]|nr:haloacid dehalogenase-like hydrolase [Stellaceae bacterium]